MVEVETFSTWTSLDDANLGLCLPAIEAEGRIELPVTVVGNNVESSETDDLLKWIMDDNQIADFNFPNEAEEATTSFLIEEVKEEMGEASKANKRSRVKTEELTEEEKYRRMREQNNRASQACRAKRKRKLAEEEKELTTLQEKNIHLQAVFKSMQEEVALYKKRILEQVAGVDHLAGEEHPPAGRVQEHAGRGGPVQEKDPGAGCRSEKLKYNRSR